MSAVGTLYHLGNNDGSITIERVQDCQPVLNEVKAIKDATTGISESGDIYHIGRIPAVIVEGYCNQRGITFHEFIADDVHIDAIMNDPDYKHFRIWDGAV